MLGGTMKILYAVVLITILSLNPAIAGEMQFHPVQHASFVIDTGQIIIYVDPVGDRSSYEKFGQPDILLVTDIHGDHLAPELLAHYKGKASLVGTKEVIKKAGFGMAMANGQKTEVKGITIAKNKGVRSQHLISCPKYR